MNFNIRQKGRKSNRDKFLIKLTKSPAIMAPGNSTLFLSEKPIEICDGLKKLLQEKQAGINSDVIKKNAAYGR